jgi:hypothetical protein
LIKANKQLVSSDQVVLGILNSRYELLGVEKLTVDDDADLIDDNGLEIEEVTVGKYSQQQSRTKGVVSFITTTDDLVEGHLTIVLFTVLKA